MIQKLLEPVLPLRNRTFATLYWAQTISLLGDAFTWIGLALLAYQIDKDRSAVSCYEFASRVHNLGDGVHPAQLGLDSRPEGIPRSRRRVQQ